MPVRSLNSSIFKWPTRDEVHQALLDWVERQAGERPELARAGYFGSYARGDWGVGSDLDLILVVERSEKDFWERPGEWDATGLPVPVEMLVYTENEWQALKERGERFSRTLEDEAVWVYNRPAHEDRAG